MIRIRRLVSGGILSTAVVALVAMLSGWPILRVTPDGVGVVKLSFSHGGEQVCRQLTEAERATLPQNMRRKEICERRRAPVHIELEIDGAPTFSATLPPSGLAGDGPSRLYRRFVLDAGPHVLVLRLRDTALAQGFTHTARREITLASRQSLAIDFAPTAGGFTFD
jgi:hypothetical protein